jgi:hypothetical protein
MPGLVSCSIVHIQLCFSCWLFSIASPRLSYDWILCYSQSKEECDYLISLAKPHMKKSTVVDSATGGSKDSRSEHSWSYNFRNVTPPVVLILHDALYAGCGQVQECFLEEGRTKLFVQLRKG